MDWPSIKRFGNGSRLKKKKKSVPIDANEKEMRRRLTESRSRRLIIIDIITLTRHVSFDDDIIYRE